MPATQEKQMPVAEDPRLTKNLDNLFGIPPEDDDDPQDTPPVEDKPKEDAPPPAKKDDSPPPDDDDSIDYDKADEPPPKADDEDPPNETAARKQAKEKGREAKELKAKLTERELELERIIKEKEDLAARVSEIEAVKIKPSEHPDFVAQKAEVQSDVNAASRRLRGEAKTLLPKLFGEFMQDYLEANALDGQAAIEADEKLTAKIFDKLKLSEVPYEELSEEERATYQPTLDKVMDVIERNHGKTRALIELHDKLEAKAKSGKMVSSVREYEKSVEDFKPVLDAVGDLPDTAIEADPHSIEAVVTALVKESPDFAKRLSAAKRDALEVVVGPKPLTLTEIERLEANGTDVKEFMVERQKLHREKQRKFLAMFVQSLATRALFKTIHKEWSELKGVKISEESEFDALRSTHKTKAAPAAKEAPKKKTTDSVLNNLFGDDDDE